MTDNRRFPVPELTLVTLISVVLFVLTALATRPTPPTEDIWRQTREIRLAAVPADYGVYEEMTPSYWMMYRKSRPTDLHLASWDGSKRWDIDPSRIGVRNAPAPVNP